MRRAGLISLLRFCIQRHDLIVQARCFFRRTFISGISGVLPEHHAAGDHCVNVLPCRHCDHHSRILYGMGNAFEMVIQHQLPSRVRQQQAMVHFDHILRNLHPGTLGIIILMQNLRKLHISQVLMIMELQLLEHVDHFIDIDVPKMYPHPPKLRLFEYLQDLRIHFPGRNRIVISGKWDSCGSPADQIQRQYLVKRSLMHIDRPRMQFVIGLGFVHFRDHS